MTVLKPTKQKPEWDEVGGSSQINSETNMTVLMSLMFTFSYFLSCGREPRSETIPNWTLFTHYCYPIPSMPQLLDHTHNTTCSKSYCLCDTRIQEYMYVWYCVFMCYPYNALTTLMNLLAALYGKTFVQPPSTVVSPYNDW